MARGDVRPWSRAVAVNAAHLLRAAGLDKNHDALAARITEQGWPVGRQRAREFANGTPKEVSVDEAVALARLLNVTIGELVSTETAAIATSPAAPPPELWVPDSGGWKIILDDGFTRYARDGDAAGALVTVWLNTVPRPEKVVTVPATATADRDEPE